jgi:hypothetical protein
MNPQINGPIEEEKKNQVNDSCYSGSNSRFLKQIFHVITHLKFISNDLHKLTKTLPETLAKPVNLKYTTSH